ncbi:MAG: glycosyltransferase [Chloroflexales bacterium]|nr:glycosyltransferase [Chloroflexales bacterium]
MSNPKYAIVSTEMRRDLEDPISFFQNIDVTHLYNITPWNDMVREDFSQRTLQYRNARDLSWKLRAINPDIVQGVEPFALKPLPRLYIIDEYTRRCQKPLVLVSLENLPFSAKYGPIVRAVEPLLRRAIAQASLLIYINDGARQNFEHYGADPAKMVRLMYGCWGINTAEFSPSGPVADLLDAKTRVILFVGRVHRITGVFDLLAAFRDIAPRVPDSHLVFIGAGPAEESLRRQSAALGLTSRVTLLGSIKNRELAQYMRRAEILVAPSLTTRFWAEQVGMVLLQAMGCGVPVVSSTSGSIPEFVIDGVTGLLAPEHNPSALAAAMLGLLSHTALRERMSAQAREYAVERFDARQNVLKAEEIILRRYEELCAAY